MADNMGVNPFVSSGGDLQLKAKALVFQYIAQKGVTKYKYTHPTLTLDEVFIVWFSKSLQNWKAVISTSLPDGLYYEVTHNGRKRETYLDVYQKVDHERYVEPSDG